MRQIRVRFTEDELLTLASAASMARFHRHAAKCFAALGDLVKAKNALDAASQDPAEHLSAEDLSFHAGSIGE